MSCLSHEKLFELPNPELSLSTKSIYWKINFCNFFRLEKMFSSIQIRNSMMPVAQRESRRHHSSPKEKDWKEKNRDIQLWRKLAYYFSHCASGRGVKGEWGPLVLPNTVVLISKYGPKIMKSSGMTRNPLFRVEQTYFSYEYFAFHYFAVTWLSGTQLWFDSETTLTFFFEGIFFAIRMETENFRRGHHDIC